MEYLFFSFQESGDKYERGVVFYVKDEKIVGVLLVNLIGAGIDVARYYEGMRTN